MWLEQPLHWAPSHAQTQPSGKLGIKSFPYEGTQQRSRLTNRQTGDSTSALSLYAPPFFFPLPSPFSLFSLLLLSIWAQAVSFSSKAVILLPNQACLSRCDATSQLSHSKLFFRWIYAQALWMLRFRACLEKRCDGALEQQGANVRDSFAGKAQVSRYILNSGKPHCSLSVHKAWSGCYIKD